MCGVYETQLVAGGVARRLVHLASTVISYGFMGDVVNDSENMRSLGPIRYKIAGRNKPVNLMFLPG